MKSPWVNLVLLLTLLVQVITGYLGMLTNIEPQAWVLWAHGVGAYLLVVLFIWKGQVIWDAVRRKRVWTRQRILFMVTLVLLLLTLVLGLQWTINGPHYFLTISTLSWHIYVAIPVMALMLWHAWEMRFIWRVKGSRDRRAFLNGLGALAAGTVLWRAVAVAKEVAELPGAARRFTGSFERGSFTGRFPAVSWIADNPAPIDAATWQLDIRGAVATPRTYSYADLRALQAQAQQAILDCTGGWYTEQIWRGVALADLLQAAHPNANARSITVRSVTGYARRFTLAEANQYLLALDVADGPIRHGNGFPLRLVAHDKRGVTWVKWISAIKVNTTSKHLQAPLPLQ